MHCATAVMDIHPMDMVNRRLYKAFTKLIAASMSGSNRVGTARAAKLCERCENGLFY
jgi:hypothetical protein